MTLEPPRHCPRCGAAFEGGAASPRRCAACGETTYLDPKVATGVVVEHGDGILLVRRNHEPMMGRWAFPSGYVDAGEVVEEAAVREVREETGVEVALDALLGVWSQRGERVIFIAYAGHSVGGAPAAGPEAFEVATFAPDALPALAFPHDDEVIAAWERWRSR